MASTDGKMTFLRGVDLFADLADEELEHIAGFLEPVDLKKGESVFGEGEKGDALYIVERGTVVSTKRLPNGREREVATFSSGDFFGEMAIFENAPRSAACRAGAACGLYALHSSSFFKLIMHEADIAVRIMYRMLHITSRRLHERSEFLTDLVQWGETARRRAITDEATGAYNRRYLDEELLHYFERSRTSGRPFSIIMIDLDGFRDLNERIGFEAGTSALAAVAGEIRAALGERGILARYGGDEFLAILPESGPGDAASMAERLRQDVARLRVGADDAGTGDHVTLSAGVASCPRCASTLDALLAAADRSLYAAKEEGKNRIVIAAADRTAAGEALRR